jgi:UDP-N-acetyl-D-mannosaminuronate dehydrogenase
LEPLTERGADADYNDPIFRRYTRCGTTIFHTSGQSIKARSDRGLRLCIIATDHSSYEYEMIVKNAKLVVDHAECSGAIEEWA